MWSPSRQPTYTLQPHIGRRKEQTHDVIGYGSFSVFRFLVNSGWEIAASKEAGESPDLDLHKKDAAVGPQVFKRSKKDSKILSARTGT